MNGLILDCKHFAAHDGPGIRLVVFLKGCPLRCKWCHTPESQHRLPEVMYHQNRCLDCGRCGEIRRQLPLTSPSEIRLEQLRRCPVNAVSLAGNWTTAESIVAEAEKEKIFFDESNGGLTISGGEPLFQADFTLEILKLAAAKNINCCIETCGFGNYDDLKRFLPYTDIFLYDCKASSPEVHKKLTGQSNELILENLRKLDADGARICLRCPLIPGINDQTDHLNAIAQLANELPHVEAIHIEPYHPMARGKYQALQREFADLPEDFPDGATLEYYIKTISGKTAKEVVLA